jgi:3-hydroxy-9,10-secoandrosta-1,3,5(10)-triene-9,17-dione monooxygenase reductase component
VHVLRDDQADLAMKFASSSRDDRFSGLQLTPGVTSAPCLAEAHARIECRLEACHDGGDHVIVVGEVVAAEAFAGLPLLYWRGQLGAPTAPEGEAQSEADGGPT